MTKNDEREDDLATRISFAIGRRVRVQRIRRGLMAKELAAMVNLNSDQIVRYERGEYRMTVGVLFLVANALGVPITYFFDDIAADARVRMTPIKADKEATAEAHELVMHLARLATQLESARSRALLLMLLEQLPGGQRVARAEVTEKPRVRVKRPIKGREKAV